MKCILCNKEAQFIVELEETGDAYACDICACNIEQSPCIKDKVLGRIKYLMEWNPDEYED